MSAVTLIDTIQRPVEDVFVVLTHLENAAKWSRALQGDLTTPGRPVSLAIIEGTPGREQRRRDHHGTGAR